jgi:centrosomal CEP192-like protein
MCKFLARPSSGQKSATQNSTLSNDHGKTNSRREPDRPTGCGLNRWNIGLFFLSLSCQLLPLLLSGCGAVVVKGTGTEELLASPGTVIFGNLPVGHAATAGITLFNQASSPVEITKLTVSGESFSVRSQGNLPVSLPVGGTYHLTVEFDPTTIGVTIGQLTITGNPFTSRSAVVGLSGTGTTTNPALSALACSSGSVTGAGTDACTVTLSVAAPSGGFSVSLSSSNAAVSVPASLNVPANATSAGFTATVSAVSSAQSVPLTASAGGISRSFALQLNAAATSILSINATSVSFGNVVVNTPTTQSVTLTSTGTAAVTVSAATVTGTGFTLSGATFPMTLNPSQTATLNVQFDPTTTGAATGQLTITSNSSTNGTATISLSGTGIHHQVDLNWSAPTGSSDPIAGYKVYRAPSGSSSYQLLNSSIDAQTTYTDSTPQSGTTYQYYVTSVDSSGAESAPSNSTSVTIP